jgi:murein DD-endopeptidase MepM/ murein hydrolase activator NlpD
LIALCMLAACRPSLPVGDLPTPVPLQTPEPAAEFDFPLDPAHFGVYIPFKSGPLPVDTRFGVQNPGVGQAGKCFVNARGDKVPFDQLYHAGEDWFALDGRGQADGLGGIGAPVHAVANGVVTWEESLGSEGYVIVVEHVLPDSSHVWSAYWHVAGLQASVGQAVQLGQVIGRIHDRSYNSHLHWEIRTFGDGSNLFPLRSSGEHCNGHVAAVGYTWDDDPDQARPEAWGYLPPSEFIRGH